MELEVYKKSDFYEDYIDSQKEYYERANADAYFAERLAEKDREIALLKERICNGDVSRLTWIDDCIAKDKEIAELKQKLESVQASMYCDVVDANMENRRLKRALWMARAERYKIREFIAREEGNLSNQMSWSRILRDRTYNQWVDQLLRIANLANKLQNKCRAKAEEYK